MSMNVFADLGMPNPEERLLKAKLVLVIREMVASSGLAQTQIAERVGMTQPAVSRMLKGMTRDVSIEKLLNVITALGHNICISIDEAETESADTKVEVMRISDIADERGVTVAGVS